MIDGTQRIEARVTGHPFLSGMPANHIKVLAGCAKLLRFASDEIMFRAGEPADSFYLVESGEVAIGATTKKKKLVTIDTVSAGAPLGWSWIFEPYRWQYDARATQPTTALFFDAKVLRQHRADDETFGHELIDCIFLPMKTKVSSCGVVVLGLALGLLLVAGARVDDLRLESFATAGERYRPRGATA